LIRTQNRETFNINKEKYVTISLEMKRTLLPFLTALLLVSCPNPGPSCGFDACQVALEINPQEITLEQGASVPLSITPKSSNGYTGSVQIIVSGTPNGVTAKLDTTNVQVGGTPAKSVLTLTADATAVVSVNTEVTITAVGQTVGAQKKFKLTIKAKPVTPPTPTITVSPISVSVKAGDSTQSFTAAVQNSSNSVNWSLNPNVGTLSNTTGTSVNYTPPTTITQNTSVTLTATIAGTSIADAATIAITPKAPSSPGSFTASAASSSAINLSWTAPTGATAYILERNPGSGFVPIVAPSASATTYTDSGLAASTSYTYRLTATNSGGSGPSVTASASTPTPVATTITISPKPAPTLSDNSSLVFTASLNGTGNVTWSLSGSTGNGTLSSTTGTSVNFTAHSTAGAVGNTVTLTATLDGTSKTDYVDIFVEGKPCPPGVICPLAIIGAEPNNMP
jgi:predicted secreted protein